MKTTIWLLDNPIKHYDWGSIDALNQLFNIPNPDHKPMAELWMGAHPEGFSIAIDASGNKIRLDELIKQNPETMLGSEVNKQFHSLPYLFKILCAGSPLSIQVHPELSKAKLGFARENNLDISLSSPKRNYKDPNHKPELVYAITPFWAMNGFRPIDEIITLFTQLDISGLAYHVEKLQKSPTPSALQTFFKTILELDDSEKVTAINDLGNKYQQLNSDLCSVIKDIMTKYPNDSGVLAPLILNVIKLSPGEAMFLKAETPHAYLNGTSLEIMANSDNVLRAGLTPKYIDIDELLDNTKFDSIPSSELLNKPVIQQNKTIFPIPVNDFKFEIIHSENQQKMQIVTSPEILLCIDGEVTISTANDSYTLKKGQSVFVAFAASNYQYVGQGIIARAFC